MFLSQSCSLFVRCDISTLTALIRGSMSSLVAICVCTTKEHVSYHLHALHYHLILSRELLLKECNVFLHGLRLCELDRCLPDAALVYPAKPAHHEHGSPCPCPSSPHTRRTGCLDHLDINVLNDSSEVCNRGDLTVSSTKPNVSKIGANLVALIFSCPEPCMGTLASSSSGPSTQA